MALSLMPGILQTLDIHVTIIFRLDSHSCWFYFYFLIEVVFKELDYDNRPTSKMIGSDFKEEFSLAQFHFHWGENNGQGSL